jgi:hypothetical protein
MTPFDRAFVFFFVLALLALFFFLAWLAIKGLEEACRQVRFRCGRVRDDGEALDRGEMRAFLDIAGGYGKWAGEPAYREIRTSTGGSE